MKLIKVILNFGHLFEPFSFNKADAVGKYSACLLIPKTDTEQIEMIENEISEIVKQMKKSSPKWRLKSSPLRDGDEEKADQYPEFEGHYFMSVKSTYAPKVVDRKTEPMTNKDEIYDGCIVNAMVTLKPFDKAGSSGISCYLGGIQKVKDGTPLSRGNGTYFDILEDTEDDIL